MLNLTDDEKAELESVQSLDKVGSKHECGLEVFNVVTEDHNYYEQDGSWIVSGFKVSTEEMEDNNFYKDHREVVGYKMTDAARAGARGRDCGHPTLLLPWRFG
ncbi:hypothetical protein [Litorimonas sp.]|uniref:hypothetical protein n=1 Tax=Litorimonas sp. TaxID=1892381 RepID=UPI003A875E2D